MVKRNGAKRLADAFWKPAAMGICFLLLLGGCSAPSRTSQSSPDSSPAGASRIREDMRTMIRSAQDRVYPALVNVNVVTVRYWGGQERKTQSTGSGTIISPDGYVLTNYHVARRGRKFECTLADKREVEATLVGEDPLTDLAVLKLNLQKLEGADTPLPVATLGDSAKVRVGDYVMAMGSPFSLSRSVTLGIVSNTERVFTAQGGGDEPAERQIGPGQRTGMFTRWIQHDAAINPGNSGGPLVNLEGQVVGVNTLGEQNMGFAIPSNLAKTVSATLIEHGEVPRSYIGVSIKAIKNTGLERGVLVDSIVEGGPAHQAGIRAGDVIIAMNGEPVTVRFPEEIPPLAKRIAEMPIGSTLTLTYERKEETLRADVVTEKLQKDTGEEDAFRAWGLSATEITEKMVLDKRLEGLQGVYLTGVRQGGPAQLAEPALHAGDVIRSIDGETIDDFSSFLRRYESHSELETQPEYILVEFDRNGKSNLTLLKPKPEKDDDPPREVPKAWIGIATQPVLEKLARQLGHEGTTGFRVTRVYPFTEAAGSELQVGDLIMSLNGESVGPRGMQDAGMLARRIRKLDIDEQATLTVLRNGQEQDVAVTLERTRIGPEEARRDLNRDFDLTVRELTFFDRDDNRWEPTTRGVLVDQVESAGWAGLGGLSGGDLIQKIDDTEIKGLKTYRKVMEDITEAQPERIVFVILRGSQTRYLYVEPEWKPASADHKDP